jgi:hypothetical protein
VGDPFFFFFFSLEFPGVFFSPMRQTRTQKSDFVAQEGLSLTRISQEKNNPKKEKPIHNNVFICLFKSSLMIHLMTLILKGTIVCGPFLRASSLVLSVCHSR